jgi:hypothetical protein
MRPTAWPSSIRWPTGASRRVGIHPRQQRALQRLHDRGYPSIGCEPCTRAIQPGEDVRAGRWWWENPESKECGLHLVDGKLIRIKSVAA